MASCPLYGATRDYERMPSLREKASPYVKGYARMLYGTS